MGNRVSAVSLIGFILAATFAAFLLSPSPASAARSDVRASVASGVLDVLTQRLCDRQKKLGDRLVIPLIHPSKCEPTPPPAEPTVTLTANPTTINEGESATLTWSSTNATSCEAFEGWSGSKGLSGSQSVSPTETTTYQLDCTGPGGTGSDDATVTVTVAEPDEPTVEITADPMTITAGNSSTLTWNSENADSCEAANGWSGTKAVDDSEVVSPAVTTTYAITCTGDGGSANDSVTVTVNAAEPDTATLTLVKVVTNNDEGTAEADDWTLSADGPTDISGTSGSAAVTNAVVDVGSYTLSESNGPAGYTASEYSCVKNGGAAVSGNSITLADGDTATCTITNDDNAAEPEEATLTLVKVIVNDDDGTAEADDWTLVADGPSDISGVTGSVAVTNATVSAGDYTLSENNGPSGYTASEYSCIKNSEAEVVGNSITLADGDVATCTITNDDNEPAQTLDHLLISEVHYDPDVAHGADNNEWVEIHNPTGATVDLSFWSIADASTQDDPTTNDILPSGTSIPSGGFLVIVSTSTTAGFWPAGATVVQLSNSLIGGGLANGGDAVFLRNNATTTVDAMSYGSVTVPFTLSGVADGHSLFRSSLTVDTDTAVDWADDDTPTFGF